MANPKLHELLAVEGDRGAVANNIIDEAVVTFRKREELFHGQVRTLSMMDESRSREDTTETKPLVTTVATKLDYVAKRVAPYYDVLLQRDSTNQIAKADLVVDGKTMAKDLPATFLLTMETQLKRLRQTYDVIPTLNPGIKWVSDEAAGAGIFRQEEASVTMRTEKAVRSQILIQPTKEHPAQIEKWHEDVPIGRIETTRTTGVLKSADKAALLERIDTLIRAVKKARQRANTAEVVKAKLGADLFAYIRDG